MLEIANVVWNKLKRKQIIGVITLLVAALVYWQQSQTQQEHDRTSHAEPSAPRRKRTSVEPRTPEAQVPQPSPQKTQSLVQLSSFADAIAARKSEKWMTVSVRVVKTLPDDNKGSRHQRFLIEGRDGNTVLVAHNIDLAKSVPIKRLDPLEIRGRYEWNEKGGVLHWTHRDSSGRQSGGWIRHRGTEYR